MLGDLVMLGDEYSTPKLKYNHHEAIYSLQKSIESSNSPFNLQSAKCY